MGKSTSYHDTVYQMVNAVGRLQKGLVCNNANMIATATTELEEVRNAYSTPGYVCLSNLKSEQNRVHQTLASIATADNFPQPFRATLAQQICSEGLGHLELSKNTQIAYRKAIQSAVDTIIEGSHAQLKELSNATGTVQTSSAQATDTIAALYESSYEGAVAAQSHSVKLS